MRGEAESMLELRRLTQNLNPSDRGNLTETWYSIRHDELSAHPTMTRDANPGISGREGRGVRSPDFVERETPVELKSTRIGLGPEEVTQIFGDLLACQYGGVVTLEDGTLRTVRSLRLVFSDVRGARGAAGFRGQAEAAGYTSSFYDKATRTSVVLVQDREVSPAEMGIAVATCIHQILAEPVDQVAFVFTEGATARRQLAALWLYGLEVRAVTGDGEGRIDVDYQPPPVTLPAWVGTSRRSRPRTTCR